MPLVPLLAMGAIGWLMLNLHAATWRNFGVWMAAGLLFYLIYGRHRSRLARGVEPDPPAEAQAAAERSMG